MKRFSVLVLFAGAILHGCSSETGGEQSVVDVPSAKVDSHQTAVAEPEPESASAAPDSVAAANELAPAGSQEATEGAPPPAARDSEDPTESVANRTEANLPAVKPEQGPPVATTAPPGSVTGLPGAGIASSNAASGFAQSASAPPGAATGLPGMGTVVPAPVPEKPPEPEPVSWVQRLRFWDMANRIVAMRSQESLELDEAGTQEFAIALNRLRGLHDHMYSVQQMLAKRKQFADSDYFKQQLLASLRGEVALPEGTRDRGAKLRQANQFEPMRESNDSLNRLERLLISDQLTKGDLLKLALRLREDLMHLISLRERELALDEFLLSFPFLHARDVTTKDVWAWYPDIRMTTARELWTATPPDWFRDEHTDLHKAYSELIAGTGRRSFVREKVDALPDVMANSEFQKLIVLANRFEELSGGGDRLLIFPEIHRLPERDRIVEASRRNLAAIKKADNSVVRDFRGLLYDSLNEKQKEFLAKPKKVRDNTLHFFDSDPTSAYSLVEEIDSAPDREFGLEFFKRLRQNEPAGDDFLKLILERRTKALYTEARSYFSRSE